MHQFKYSFPQGIKFFYFCIVHAHLDNCSPDGTQEQPDIAGPPMLLLQAAAPPTAHLVQATGSNHSTAAAAAAGCQTLELVTQPVAGPAGPAAAAAVVAS